MISEGRIPMNAEEQAAAEDLLAANPGVNATLTRRDPGEEGPLLVHLDATLYEINGSVVEKVS